MGTQVLIFDPLNSISEKDPIEILWKEEELNCFCLHVLNISENISGANTDIIFFILNKLKKNGN